MIPNSGNAVVVFTDGSSRGNPGPGGYAAVIVYKSGSGEVKEVGAREERTTNNRMELRAAIEALSSVSKVKGQLSIVIYTDSSYLVNGITTWVYSWERRNWVTMDKKPVLNKDLWEKLMEICRNKDIKWKVVGGHVGVAGNMRCDEIATAFADNLPPKLYSGPLSSYPVKNILDIKADSFLSERKESGKARSSAKAYSYVSLVDGVVETHTTWAECERRVKGKPARYKKALTEAEEEEIIRDF